MAGVLVLLHRHMHPGWKGKFLFFGADVEKARKGSIQAADNFFSWIHSLVPLSPFLPTCIRTSLLSGFGFSSSVPRPPISQDGDSEEGNAALVWLAAIENPVLTMT